MIRVWLISIFFINFIAQSEYWYINVDNKNPSYEELKTVETVFDNTQYCSIDNSCSLKDFKVIKKDYRIWVIDRWHYGSKLVSIYNTDKVQSLEDYGVVQFIKGCLFTSEKIGNEIKKYFDIGVYSFDEIVIFNFNKFTIDSIDKDPMYGTYPNDLNLRHFYYKWADSDNYNNYTYYGVEKPVNPRLFVTDHPGQAYILSANKAKNVALEFLTCIYKTKNIPLTTHRDDIWFFDALGTISLPLYCARNIVSFIYDFNKKEFYNVNNVDEICKK